MNHLYKLSVVLLIFTLACNKSSIQTEEKKSKLYNKPEPTSSVSIKNGKYFIDTNLILKFKYQKMLVDRLWKENLVEIKEVKKIPSLIKNFLDEISPDHHFSMTDSGEVYDSGLMAPLEVIGTVDCFNKTLHHLVTYPQLGRIKVPNKQLVYFGFNDKMALLTYYSGQKEYVAILSLEKDQVKNFWYDNWPSNEFDVRTKNDILNCLQNMRVRIRQKNDGC